MGSSTDRENNRNNNGYEGNGWSKYQLMVLQQLEDHSEVLHNLNKEIVEIKQTMAVSETELKMWRTATMSDLKKIEKQIESILHEDNGINSRLNVLEINEELRNRMANKSKALWAAVGAALVCIVDLIAKSLAFFQ